MNWSELDFKNYMDQLKGDEPESVLQKQIVDDCISRGWPVHSHNQSKAYYKVHTKGAGWADATILMAKGRTVHLELKSKKGTMRQAQIDMKNMCRLLGHEYYKIKVWAEYAKVRDK